MRGRSAGILLLVLAVMLTMLPPARVEAAITTPFTTRFDVNANGSIMLRGNANLTCPVHLLTPTCAAARNGTGSSLNEELNDNGYPMVFTDADGDAATFNDSNATITMPAGSSVLFAGLYWGADPSAGSSLGALLGAAAPSAPDKNKVLFRTPSGATWHPITASSLYTISPTGAYQGFADVTGLVAGAGNGVYAVANIQSGRGTDRYAGWTLVIAYRNPAEDLRSLRVYDGFGSIASGSVNIPVTGFEAPHTGIVNAEVGAVAYEGDLGKTGDGLRLNGQSLSDAANPANNVFNSTVSDGGVSVAGRNPAYSNLFGVDIDQFDASGKLANAATSATLTMTTAGETYYPGVITIAIDLYAPKIVTTATATDVNGGVLVPGDEIEYRITVRNDGNDIADGVTLADAIPVYTTYVPGSLTVQGSAFSDAVDGDRGEVSGGTAVFRLGSIPYQGTTYVTFRVRVGVGAPSGYAIANLVNVSYTGRTTSVAVASVGGTVASTVNQPDADLAAALTVSPAYLQRAATPRPVAWTATVTNAGPHPEPAVRAVLTLPAGVTPDTLPTGCTAAGQVVTCLLGPLLATHQANVTIPATVTGAAAADATATLAVSGDGRDTVSGNNTGTASVAVNSPPVAVADSAGTTNGVPVTFDVRSNDSDPDDAASGLGVSIVSAPGHGTAVVAADGTVTYTPTLGWTGADTFGYEVNDGNGGTDTATATVTTANALPIARDDEKNTRAGTPVIISVLDNDSDPNTLDLPFVVAAGQPAPGTGTVLQVGPLLTYTPALGFTGRAHFTYTIQDLYGGQAVGHVYIDVENAAPTAADDVADTAHNTGKSIDVLDNDTDPNSLFGDYLTIISVDQPPTGTGSTSIVNNEVFYQPPLGFSGTAAFSYTAEDTGHAASTATVTVTVRNALPVAADRVVSTGYRQYLDIAVLSPWATDPNPGDVLRVSGTANPTRGTATVQPDGTIRYTPDAGFSGTDQFDYTIDDGHGGSDVGRIDVTVANALPVARPDAVTVQAGVPLAIDVMANDDDDPNGVPATITVTALPAHGTVSIGPGRMITYTPGAGHRGPETFGYTLSDGQGSSAAAVTIGVVNSAPVARPDAAATDTGTAVTVAVLDNDEDPNGDLLTLAGVAAAAHGTIVRNPDGTLTYTPAAGFYGTDSISYAIEDPERLADSAVLTITVRNAAPIAVDDAFVAHPKVATPLAVLDNDTDPNAGQLLTVASAGAAAKGVVTLNADGTLTYRSTGSNTGLDTFTYVLTDDLGRTDTGAVTITINGPPVAVADTASTGPAAPVTIPVAGNDTDPEGDALTVVSVGTPGHGTAGLNADGSVWYAPSAAFAGVETFGYDVRDTLGNRATGQITVTVANAPPIARPDEGGVLTGRTVTIDVLANDSDVNTGQTLVIASPGSPGHGTATVSGGRIRYTPAAGWLGRDTFVYTVSDGAGGLGTAVVGVTVSDGRPVAVADFQDTPYRRAVIVPVLANDVDPAGSLTVVAVTQPARGTVTYGARTVTFTPPDGFSGPAVFGYTAQDDAGQRVTANVTITVDAPPKVPDRATVTKPGDPVAVPLPVADNAGRPVTIVSVGTPAHGTVVLNADGTVTYRSNPGFSGTDTFTYTVVDAFGNAAEATIVVLVGDPLPPLPTLPRPARRPRRRSPPHRRRPRPQRRCRRRARRPRRRRPRPRRQRRTRRTGFRWSRPTPRW